MKTTKTNETASKIVKGWSVAAAMGIVLTVSTGCSVLDSIDRQLGAWGVVDARMESGIDPLAVVMVEAGQSRGAGVVLEGGLVFTACHVLGGSDTAVIRTTGYYTDSYYQVLTARVVYRDAASDQALLAVEGGAMEHTAKLGVPAAGAAVVTPMRPAGKSSMGETVCRPVVRTIAVGSSLVRWGGEAGLAKGDSGCPIVQDGAVVGLVRGDGIMVSSDVMVNYKASRRASRGASAMDRMDDGTGREELKAPELSVKASGADRS